MQPIRGNVPITQAINRPKAAAIETNVWYWNPGNAYVRLAPPEFRDRLKREMGDELDVTWNPIIERWQVWSRAPKIQHKVCAGWRLLFIHNGPQGEYAPLDERIFARLFASSVMAHGSGKQYFDRIANEMERDREKQERTRQQETIDLAMPSWEFSQIKNIGKGNKFSTYHA